MIFIHTIAFLTVTKRGIFAALILCFIIDSWGHTRDIPKWLLAGGQGRPPVRPYPPRFCIQEFVKLRGDPPPPPYFLSPPIEYEPSPQIQKSVKLGTF